MHTNLMLRMAYTYSPLLIILFTDLDQAVNNIKFYGTIHFNNPLRFHDPRMQVHVHNIIHINIALRIQIRIRWSQKHT